ncbi:MAG: hypothetical protein JW729_05560, partial [Bacteroidales bacterium]|nr:hypothetical protein [Bacteroidales bacterium]
SLRKYSKPVLTLRDETTTQYDFLKYLFENRASLMPENVGFVIRKSFKEFADKQCLAFEDKHLEEKEFDFRMIMNEYRDGILLFDLMDKKVWSKASEDSLGLENYYNQNKKKFQWKKRAVLSVFEFKSPEYADSIQNMLLQGKTDEEVFAYFASDSLKQVTLKTEKVEKGSKAEIDALKWKKEAVYLLNNEQGKAKSVVVFRDILQPSQKDFSETRGMVIANYQDFLEKKWIDELKAKYQVLVNKDVLKELKKRKD